jgi:hypothetical protein
VPKSINPPISTAKITNIRFPLLFDEDEEDEELSLGVELSLDELEEADGEGAGGASGCDPPCIIVDPPAAAGLIGNGGASPVSGLFCGGLEPPGGLKLGGGAEPLVNRAPHPGHLVTAGLTGPTPTR